MNNNIRQFQDSIFSSLYVNERPHYRKPITSIKVVGEAVNGGEIDYLWMRIFTRLCAGAVKPREQVAKFRRKKRYQPSIFPATLSIRKAIYLTRKINLCLLEAKDPKYIKKVESINFGFYKVRIRRCEKYPETKRLAKYWKRYLEDIKLNYVVVVDNKKKFNDADYILDLHGLRLINVE